MVIDRLFKTQIDHGDIDCRAVVVVFGCATVILGGIGIGLVDGRDLGEIRDRCRRVDAGNNGQRGTGSTGHCADLPDAGGRVVGTGGCGGRKEGKPGRQLILDRDVGGGIRPRVGQGQGEGCLEVAVAVGLHLVCDRHRLREAQVGLLGVDRHRTEVIANAITGS